MPPRRLHHLTVRLVETLGLRAQAPAGTVVATDPASVDADYDNGIAI